MLLDSMARGELSEHRRRGTDEGTCIDVDEGEFDFHAEAAPL
jgi:hypothetical protein